MQSDNFLENFDQIMKQNPDKEDIRRISVFGSYLNGGQDDESDVDLLIEFEPEAIVGLIKFARIKRNLEDSIGKEVDLVTEEDLSEFFKNEVLEKAKIIYEKR